MGKAWEHVGSLLLIGVMVIAKELYREMEKREFDPKKETQKELNPLYDKVFGKSGSHSSDKK